MSHFHFRGDAKCLEGKHPQVHLADCFWGQHWLRDPAPLNPVSFIPGFEPGLIHCRWAWILSTLHIHLLHLGMSNKIASLPPTCLLSVGQPQTGPSPNTDPSGFALLQGVDRPPQGGALLLRSRTNSETTSGDPRKAGADDVGGLRRLVSTTLRLHS